MSVIRKDLGIATAYGYAVSKGYTGTEEEFAELMASYATVAEEAQEAAEQATQAVQTAQAAANSATTKAGEAATSASGAAASASQAGQSATAAAGSASTASAKAAEAGTSATNAAASETAATQAAQTATTKAGEASASATAASQSATAAAGSASDASDDADRAETAAGSVSAAAEQIATNTADIADLKDDFKGLYKAITYNTVDDSYWLVSGVNAGTSASYNGWKRTTRVPCNPDETLVITTSKASTYNLFFSDDADRTMVSSFSLKSGVNEIHVPSGAKYFALSNTSSGLDGTTVSKILSIYDFENLENDVSQIEKVIVTPNLADPTKFTIGYCYPPSSGAAANSTYDYTGKISVTSGETLYLTTTGRFLKALDINGNNVAASGLSSEFTSYTVPNGIYYVYITFYHADINEFMVSKYSDIEFVPYGDPCILPSYISDICTSNGFRVNGDLSQNEYLLIDKLLAVQKNAVITFVGNFTGTFGGLEIGFTTDISDSDEEHFKITNTNIERVTSSPTTYAHGLTMKDQIVVKLENNINNSLIITVESNGQKISSSNGWRTDSRMVYVKSLGSMTDCVLSWTCKDNLKKIALFGDSYLSYSEERWRYYLNEDGYSDNVFVNAYAGENSANGLINFTNLMEIINPKYILWAYGMNDTDSISAISSNWKYATEKVLSYCDKHQIIPILATIPNVPSVNNSFKNAYVRASGRRYIDFAKAVGADDDSTWFDGMLSDDNVHPTSIGAIALYYRAMADFPELAITN